MVTNSMPECHGHRAANLLVRLVEGEERWEAQDHPQGVLPHNWGGMEPNHTITCLVLKAKTNDRRKSSPLPSMNVVGLDLMLQSVTVHQLQFWSRFQHIHDDDEIAPENKFQYLVQATVNGSRAREVVESFPATAANYAKAVDSLKARFGRDDLLVEVYVRELLKLIISVQKQEKISMTSLYDKLESYLRALETLGVTTEKCASILYPMVESRFQEYFLKAWDRSATSAASTDAKERLTNLMTFLKVETEREERINLAMAGIGLGVDENRQSFKKKVRNFPKEKIPTAANLLTTASKEVKKECVFCTGKHSSRDCFQAQKMSLAERHNILREKQCFFCLLNSKAYSSFL
ncbi:uncharacterized protein TNCV_3818881 [Trichonephila clavipes]|nr:uncharacterized protein TNCV_3818881 [Trichonephila clavipes]